MLQLLFTAFNEALLKFVLMIGGNQSRDVS